MRMTRDIVNIATPLGITVDSPRSVLLRGAAHCRLARGHSARMDA
jgi:hypothetical protein